jgi:catechol 2,3-dioxygenase-like lactoylglutathione lyase family enzyme
MIGGLQQIGIGLVDLRKSWKWYKANFGIDIMMFEDLSSADFMLPYTGGKPQKRHAVMALNLQGGGGLELWQYSERTPLPAAFKILLGDLGIYITKIKCRNAKSTYESLEANGVKMLSGILTDPKGKEHFFIKDPFDNIFQLVTSDNWFKNEKKPTGSAYGAIIGVSDIAKSLDFYCDVLGYDEVVYDEESVFSEFASLDGGEYKMRRVLLRPGKPMTGLFSPLLGTSEIELVQVIGRKQRKIFENRLWGDLGFIHICFDVHGLNLLREKCKSKGYPFTVDVDFSFDMGEAAGSFSYAEDPDGTLIEFVETHKIPLLKKIGWYLDLRKRNPDKSLPRWILHAIAFNRVKN